MGKRARQEGTIYQDKAGRWWAQLPAGADGKRPRRQAATEAEALATLRQLHAERAAGRDLSRRAETVADLIDSYLDTLATHRRPGTLRVARAGAAHITRHIGALRIDTVTPDRVQALANRLTRETGPHAVLHALRLLRTAYERAIPERVARNPVQWRRLTLRRPTPAERAPFEDAEVRRLLEAADNLALRGARVSLSPAIWLMALLGLRRGEAAGLHWADVDFSRQQVTIRSQMAWDDAGAHFVPGRPTKTADGVRTLPLGPRLLARLRAHHAAQGQLRLRAGTAWQRSDLVVCLEDGAPLPSPDRIRYDLQSVANLIGLAGVHPHRLRHTVATAIADEGYSEAVIAAILGQKRRGTVTTKYVHAKPAVLRHAVEAIEQRIFCAAAAAAEAP